MKCANLKVLNLAVVCAIIMKYILVYYWDFHVIIALLYLWTFVNINYTTTHTFSILAINDLIMICLVNFLYCTRQFVKNIFFYIFL